MSFNPVFIRDKGEIERLKRRGRKLSGRYFYLRFVRDERGPRFVISVSTKYDKRAVKRNHIRRQVKEILRQGAKDGAYPMNIAVAIMPLQTKGDIEFTSLRDDLLSMLNKIR